MLQWFHENDAHKTTRLTKSVSCISVYSAHIHTLHVKGVEVSGFGSGVVFVARGTLIDLLDKINKGHQKHTDSMTD